MNTKDVTLIFIDQIERFNEVSSQISFRSFKNVFQFETFTQLELFLNAPENKEEFVVIFIHIVAKTLEGYHSALKDDISSEFPHLKYHWITRATSSIKPSDIDGIIFTYHQIKDKILKDIIQPQKISSILFKQNEPFSSTTQISDFFKVDYAIITALEENEMEKVLPMISKVGKIDNNKVLIEYGHLSSNSDKKIAYASQPSTGMVDAAILATEMILRFHPKFLIMAGVLGGKPGEVNIGDIIVSTKAFTIDKGKLTTIKLLSELEASNTDSAYITSFKRNKAKILNYIETADPTRKRHLEIHFGPVACVRQVIDKKEYFEDKVLSRDRKAIGLEMESYGVARACEIVNNGNTIPLIIKSAMDNTIDKTDEAKTYASWTSATFVKYILENNLI